jgi:hypothetical protein
MHNDLKVGRVVFCKRKFPPPELYINAVMIQYPNQILATLPPNHDIRHLVWQTMLLAEEAVDRERTPLQ